MLKKSSNISKYLATFRTVSLYRHGTFSTFTRLANKFIYLVGNTRFESSRWHFNSRCNKVALDPTFLLKFLRMQIFKNKYANEDLRIQQIFI